MWIQMCIRDSATVGGFVIIEKGKKNVKNGDNTSDLQGKTIASVILLEDQTEKVMQMAMRITAEKYGVQVIEGQSGGELEREINLINKYIEQDVDAICIYPVSPTGLSLIHI